MEGAPLAALPVTFVTRQGCHGRLTSRLTSDNRKRLVLVVVILPSVEFADKRAPVRADSLWEAIA